MAVDQARICADERWPYGAAQIGIKDRVVAAGYFGPALHSRIRLDAKQAFADGQRCAGDLGDFHDMNSGGLRRKRFGQRRF